MPWISARLPVIRGINKIAGAVVGGMKCIVFVWVGMLVLTILCNTEIGQKGLGLIRGDTVLDFLYDKNIFIRIFTGIFYGRKKPHFADGKAPGYRW